MTAATAKACTKAQGGKHAWSFVRNTSVGSMTIDVGRGSTARFTLKGLYRCQCGERKYGASQAGGGDPLRSALGVPLGGKP